MAVTPGVPALSVSSDLKIASNSDRLHRQIPRPTGGPLHWGRGANDEDQRAINAATTRPRGEVARS